MSTKVVQENKMGVMPVGKLLVNMALPMIISMLVQALYNVVDSIYVSQISESAVTALSLAFPVQNLQIGFAVGIGVGINSLLSKSLGERNQEAVNKAAGNGMVLMLIVTAGFMLFGFLGVRPYYEMQSNVTETVEGGIAYTSICCIFVLGSFMQILSERLLQSTGRTVLSMITQATGAITNIILDPIFIFFFDMGVSGAALATIISQGISALWVLKFLSGNKTILKIRKKHLKIDPKVLAPCMALGFAPFIMQSTESLIMLCFNNSLLKYGGDVAVGAMTVLSSAMQMVMMPLQGLTQGAQPIISYNFGARNADRVRDAFKLLLKCCLTYSACAWALCMVFPRQIGGVFTDNQAIIDVVSWALRVYMGGTIIFGAQIACQQTFVALGNAKTSAFLAIFRKIIVLVPLIFILPPLFPAEGKVFAVWLAEPVADVLAVTMTTTLFRKQFKESMAQLEQ